MESNRARSIGALITRLIESAKTFAYAEITLAKCTALEWFGRVKIALVLIATAMLLAISATTVMLAALGMALATWLGAAGGLAVAALIGFAIAGALALLAVKRFNGTSG